MQVLGSVALLSHNTLKLSVILGLSFILWCWWPRKSVLQGSSALGKFCTSLSKVLTLQHCVKVKQRYHCYKIMKLQTFFGVTKVYVKTTQTSRGDLKIFVFVSVIAVYFEKRNTFCRRPHRREFLNLLRFQDSSKHMSSGFFPCKINNNILS